MTLSKKAFPALAAALLAVVLPAVAPAGGALETIDITAGTPSPIPGQIAAKLVPIRWDPRCIPVQFRVNDTLDPIPNPLGVPFVTVADATAALQRSMDGWNNIRTSYIDMQAVGTTANPGTRRFDMTFELTFRVPPGSGFIASSPSTSLIADSTFVDGDDIDGDGDSDVSGAISVCTDVDNDGDIEFPAGDYKAGTILDNDIQFNASVFRFTVADADIDTVTNSVDLMATAIHELGHSHGLSHVLNNLDSKIDGTGTTMYPFIDTGDPASELSQRTLDSDDIAFSSFFYPEGTASSGPAALQHGDIPFRLLYSTIEGEVTQGSTGLPVAGASVSAVRPGLDLQEAAAFSGTTQVSFNPATGGLFLVSPAFNILDGKYRIPVLPGIFDVGIEAVDGQPVTAASISLTAQIGSIFGQQAFQEEFYNGSHEAAVETDPGAASLVLALPFHAPTGIDLVTNVNTVLRSYGSRDFIGFTGQAEKSYYAVAFPGAAIAAADPGTGLAIQAGLFNTAQADASVAERWLQAQLTTCELSGTTATVDLRHPLARDILFLAQDGDFTPFYFRQPERLGRKVLDGIANGSISNLCLVLQLPKAPFDGVSALPPLIGLDGGVAVNDVPIAGLSFVSTDGVTFDVVTNFNFMFGLEVSPLP